jgi:hypothetical protein
MCFISVEKWLENRIIRWMLVVIKDLLEQKLNNKTFNMKSKAFSSTEWILFPLPLDVLNYLFILYY